MEPKRIFSKLGARLKAFREKELKLTTRDLVSAMKRVGVKTSNASVTRYEQGRDPAVSYVVGMAVLLGSTVDYVLDETAPRERTATRKERRVDFIERVVAGEIDDALAGNLGDVLDHLSGGG